MWLLILEAGLAMFLLVFMVWWTMFSGKKTPRSSQASTPQQLAKPKDEDKDKDKDRA